MVPVGPGNDGILCPPIRGRGGRPLPFRHARRDGVSLLRLHKLVQHVQSVLVRRVELQRFGVVPDGVFLPSRRRAFISSSLTLYLSASRALMSRYYLKKGYGKRTEVASYRKTHRGGKGLINLKVTPKIGPAVAVLGVAEHDILIVTVSGKVIRIQAKQVRAVGRATQGVRL
jgi:DNA gyrase/topoisomerase IV subunit A